MPRETKLIISIVILAAVLCCAACTPKETIPPEQTVYTYAVSALTAEDLTALDKYPNLTSVDLRGSTCYEDILAYIASHPTIEVTYDVQIGQTRYDHTTTELILEDGSFEISELTANLAYLPNVTSIQLPKTNLTVDSINTIAAAKEGLNVTYTVALLGQELPGDTVELDLSTIDAAQIEEIAPALQTLPQLKSIELMAEDGTAKLAPVDVKALMDIVPEATIHYEFDLFGTPVSTATESIEFVRVEIGDEGVAQLREALDIMPSCTYLKVDRCGVSSDLMAAIRADYPDVKVSWRIFFGKFNALTDEEMLRLTFGLTDDIIHNLQYFNDCKYLDAGHNDTLSDISFVQWMPNLEILILSGSIVQDLSPLANHQNIEFLEMCYCTWVKDISPLASCPSLDQLNISFTQVKDISALDNNTNGRLCALGLRLTAEQEAKFGELHPDCLYRFHGEQCYGYAWRYDDYGYSFSDYYKNMRVIFNYDDVSYYSGRGIYNVYY